MTWFSGAAIKGRPRGLAARLLAAQSLVLVAGAVTTWLVASSIGPGIFHEHLLRAGAGHAPSEAEHVEEAFVSALVIALLVALVISVVVALVVTWYFSRRVKRSVTAVSEAASEIAEGRYGGHVPSAGLGAEFDQLAGAVNQLARRMESVETTRRRMLADLAHEMRTPLATIDAQLEAVEDGLRSLDESTFAVLRSSTARLGRLAKDMTAVSRAEEGQLALNPLPTDPGSLVGAAYEAAREAYQAKRVALTVKVGRTPAATADAQRLGQVLGNLLDNALRHTPPGGAVTLSTASHDPRSVEIAISDTGEGITPAALDRVFDRFYRADLARTPGHGGSGIGLTISRAIVEAHGGSISASSPGAGLGATFVVQLPAAR